MNAAHKEADSPSEQCPSFALHYARAAKSSSILLDAIRTQRGLVWPCGHHRTPVTTQRVGEVLRCRRCRRERLNHAIKQWAAKRAAKQALIEAARKRMLDYYERKRAGQTSDLPFSELAQSVAADFGITVADLKSGSRLPHLIDARAVVILILHERGLSYPTIARLLNRKCHSTILHAVQTFDVYVRRNPLVSTSYMAHSNA